jgi:hypothetical protein
VPRLEQPEPSQHSATSKEAGKPEPSTRTVVPATPEAGLTLREAARTGAAVTSCKPSDRTKSTSQPAIRPPIDRPCLGNPCSHESFIYLLDRVGHTLLSSAQNTGASDDRTRRTPDLPDLWVIRQLRASAPANRGRATSADDRINEDDSSSLGSPWSPTDSGLSVIRRSCLHSSGFAMPGLVVWAVPVVH